MRSSRGPAGEPVVTARPLAPRALIDKLQPWFDQRERLLTVLRGERESKDAEELCAAADMGYAHGDTQLATRAFQLAIELDPGDARVHQNLGNALLQNGEVDDAIASYGESLDLDPKNVEVWIRLGRAHAENGEMEEAIAAARMAVELAPPQPSPIVALGVALNATGRVDATIACFRKAVELDPDNAQGHVDLAPTLENLGDGDAALASFRRSIELDPTKALAHYHLGCCQQDMHLWDEAIASYRKALEFQPDYAEAHCNLAACLQALQHARRGHELGSKRADWSYPSAEWVRLAEMRVAMEEKLPLLLAGNLEPRDNAERLEYAIMCQIKKYHHASARLFADAFAAEPRITDRLGSMYDAAYSSVLAAAGSSEESSPLDDDERARLRKQALDWMRADLDRYATKLQTAKPEERAVLEVALRKWQEEPDLASIRDPAALALLPDEEQDEFGDLWADVADLLQSR